MPLLGRKIYIPRIQDGTGKHQDSFFRVQITNEVCKTKDEYEKRLEFYRQPIWTCQCTGVTGLSYQEAQRSEASAREQLEDEFPIRLERTVLELVHHSACSLDVLVDEVQTYLKNHFEIGETVELKVQLKGKIIRGKVLKVTQSSSDEWTALKIPKAQPAAQITEGSSPSSDKENHMDDVSRTPLRHAKKTLSKNFRYTIRLSDEDKIISAVPGHELNHAVPLPSWDLVKLFIRANAIQTGTNANSTWVVSDDLFTKFKLVNKYDDLTLSPYKTSYETPKKQKRSAEDHPGGSQSSKKRKLSDHFLPLGSPKMKQATLSDMSFKSKTHQSSENSQSSSSDPNIMPSPEKVRMDHTYSSPIGKGVNKKSPKPSPKKASSSKTANVKRNLMKSASKKKGESPAKKKKTDAKSEKGAKKKIASKSKTTKEDSRAEKKPRKTPTKKSSSEDDDIIDVDTIPDSGSTKASQKTPSKKKLTDHFKMIQSNTSSEDEFRSTPKRTPGKQNIKSKSPKSTPKAKTIQQKGKNSVTKTSKKTNQGTPKKNKPADKARTPVKKTKAEKETKKKKSPAKTPKKGTPKKSPSKKATPKKTPQKAKVSPVKTPNSKKSLKQMTLFDLAGKKSKTPNSQARYKLSTPQSPRQPLIIAKLIRAKRTQDVALYNKLLSKAVREINDKQVKNLKPEIRDEVTAKYEEYKMKLKWKSMPPEERKEAILQKREEKKKQRDEERHKRMQEDRKTRMEQAKRFEDQDLKLKSLPTPKLVPMPDGLPNTLFGDIAMVVEFLNCYCGLLMPNDPYPVTADCLTKALVGGSEGFAYLSRVLVILLKTLLQDKIAEDYRELNMSLSQIPVNMHTASELLRLSLRNDDQENDDHSSTNSEDFIGDDDVPQEMVELLETSEFFDLEPIDKLQLLVFLCHRILASYAVQDFMDNKQKVAARLWRDKIQSLKEKNEKLKEEKLKLREKREAERLQKEEELKQKAEAAGNTEDGNGSEPKQDEKPKEKKVRKKKDKPATNKEDKASAENEEETLDMASVVKRRRLLAAKTKAEREEQEKIEREKKIKGEEEYRRLRAQEIFEKKFEDGIQQAKMALRQTPIGTDRNHSRYWVFSSVIPGLFIEKGWVDSSVTYSTRREAKIASTGGENAEGTEKTVPKEGQNLWFQYESTKELDTLMEALDNQGIRESALYVEIKKRYQDITKMINLSRRSGPELRDSDGPKELLNSLKEDLQDIESHIRQGNLGGVEGSKRWEETLKTATKLKDLEALIIESQAAVNLKFLQGMMAPPKRKTKPMDEETKDGNAEDEDSDEEDESGIPEKVAKWVEAVESAPTLSRLHLLLSMYEACVRWEKSAENAKCKICRRKGDEDKLLLCDDCNQPFHLFCLRPVLAAVPRGDWKCPACAPSTRRSARNRSYKGMEEDDDESEDSYSEDDDESENSDASDSEIEHEDTCTVCSQDGELVLCAECPSVYHKDCHDPPMRNFPRGRWVCASCLNPSRSTRSRGAEKARKVALAKKRKQRLSTRKRKAQEDAQARATAKKTKTVFSCKIAEDIVSKMLRYRDSGPFRTTPDSSEAPDYEEVIFNPVDLHMMRDRCSSDEYGSQDEFLDDVRLMFANAKQYYEADDHIILQAQKLEDFFVNLLKWNLPDAVEVWQQAPPQTRKSNRNLRSRSQERDDHSYGRRSLRSHNQ